MSIQIKVRPTSETVVGDEEIQDQRHWTRHDEEIQDQRNLFIIKSIKRDLKTRPIYDCRCVERLEPKDDESTCLVYTGLLEELEYLKIETRLIDEKFASVMGECVI